MLKHKIFILIFLISHSISYAQWKSFYPEKNQNTKSQAYTEKKEKDNLSYNNLFFNALKQKSLENYERSITLFKKCIEKKPDFVEAYYQLSILYKKLNRIIEAKEFSTKTIEILFERINYQISKVKYPFFKTDYFTWENLLRLIDTSKVSPPFYGNEMTIYLRMNSSHPMEQNP